MTSTQRNWFTIPAAIAIAALTGCNVQTLPQVDNGNDNSELTPYSFSLAVARHTKQQFTEAQIDEIFADASVLLQDVDFECPDVACPVTFSRDGDIQTFNAGAAMVTTESQLDAIFDAPGDIKIVTSMVGVCGTYGLGDLAVVLGCAYTGGSAVLVHDAPTDVWAHEWGHVQGLPHRDDCHTNIMHTYELQTNAVNTTERNAFLSPTPGSELFRAISPSESRAAWQSPPTEGESLPDWLEATVSRPYLAGIPSDAFDAVDREAVGKSLVDMFCDGPIGFRRLNVIRAMGLVQAPDAGPLLSAFIEDRAGLLSDDDVRAVAEAFLALGRVADSDDTGTVLSYLEQATDPQMWEARGLTMADGSDAAEVFARFAIMAMGIVENPAALDHLLALEESARTGRLIGEGLADQVEEAIAWSYRDVATLRTIGRSARLP